MLSSDDDKAQWYNPDPPLTDNVTITLSVTSDQTATATDSTSTTPPELSSSSNNIVTNVVTVSPSATATNAAPSNETSTTPTGAIAGGSVGGVAFLALLGFALFFLFRRRRRARAQTSEAHVDPLNQTSQISPYTPYTPYTDANSPYAPSNNEKRDVYGNPAPADQPQELHHDPIPPQELASTEVRNMPRPLTEMQDYASSPPAYPSQEMEGSSSQIAVDEGRTGMQRATDGEDDVGLGIQGREA